jgi:hypothetical protein
VLLHPLADHRIDQPPPFLVAVDEQFARNRAVGERHDARAFFELGVEHEARRQPRMYRSEIAHRVPHIMGGGVDRNLLVNGCHGLIFL